MSQSEPSGGSPRVVPEGDADMERRFQFVQREVNRHKRIRIFGLLGILVLLAVVYPVATLLERMAIPKWRVSRLPGSSPFVTPVVPIGRIDIESKQLIIHLPNGRRTGVPIVPPTSKAGGTARIEKFGPYVMDLGPTHPCLERGSAGILRALGRTNLYDVTAGRCVRIDAEAYDAILTHATRDTIVEFQ
jgi:hypothetical protein